MEPRFEWINEPSQWQGDAERLTVWTDARTDFWQETFYGFRHDNGHAYVAPVAGDFTLSASVTGSYEVLYDQAGLMLRIDGAHWIKCGIEQTDGMMHFSVVVTNGFSDWSVVPLPDATPRDEIQTRLTRHGDAVRVQ